MESSESWLAVLHHVDAASHAASISLGRGAEHAASRRLITLKRKAPLQQEVTSCVDPLANCYIYSL